MHDWLLRTVGRWLCRLFGRREERRRRLRFHRHLRPCPALGAGSEGVVEKQAPHHQRPYGSAYLINAPPAITAQPESGLGRQRSTVKGNLPNADGNLIKLRTRSPGKPDTRGRRRASWQVRWLSLAWSPSLRTFSLLYYVIMTTPWVGTLQYTNTHGAADKILFVGRVAALLLII